MKRALIIEDDIEINQLLTIILKRMDLNITSAYSGTEGLLQLEMNSFDIVLLDLMLPGMDGEHVLCQIKENYSPKVIIISARATIEDKVTLLKMGADDYITKPFNQSEVEARVEVQLRSPLSNLQKDKYQWNDLVIDKAKREVKVNNHHLALTNSEYDILLFLIQQPEHAFSKKEIYEVVWQENYYGDDNTVSVHISNIRKKIAEYTDREYIKTVWGIGFMLI